MKLTHKEAVELIQEVFNKALEETESFDDIGKNLAYLLGGISVLANGEDQDPIVFNPWTDDEIAFVATLNLWFPINHRIWNHVYRRVS